jgi:hypothetical protein
VIHQNRHAGNALGVIRGRRRKRHRDRSGKRQRGRGANRRRRGQRRCTGGGGGRRWRDKGFCRRRQRRLCGENGRRYIGCRWTRRTRGKINHRERNQGRCPFRHGRRRNDWVDLASNHQDRDG